MKRTLVVGYGYLGRRVAQLAVTAGDRVWATTRNPAKIREMGALQIEGLRVDWTNSRSLMGLPEVDRVVVAVSYDPASRFDRYESQVGGFANLLKVLPPGADICYVSTTGVYHQSDGRWVDENSTANPTRQGGRVHLQAESLLHRMRPQSPWTILRFAGIYGPGIYGPGTYGPARVPRVADVKAGRPIASPSDGFLNLIHVDDGATAVLAAWNSHRRRLYLISDDEPVRRRDFYRHIARTVGVPDPTFTNPPADASPRMRSDSNKRIWNRRMKAELVPKLKFATYREGLADVLETA